MKYELRTTKSFERSFKKLPRQVFTHIEKEVFKLESNPESGEPLKGEFKGVYSLHTKLRRTHYRVAYSINNKTHQIDLLYVASRENFYQQLRRLKLKL